MDLRVFDCKTWHRVTFVEAVEKYLMKNWISDESNSTSQHAMYSTIV
jgi:hypothetical protein